ncbi:MAG TPA: DNA polymerase III subunit chi [Burkholderiaceae bacterium]|nr:DNA polymerase III subunit chi [Burkholderiaceae bacterium]
MRLEFHTDIADPLGYACRLLRKAYRRQLKVVVSGDSERLARLDTLLWTFEQLEFVPHARLRHGERADANLLRHTPIWLADASAAWPESDVVVNLGDQPIAQPDRCTRLIELVGADDADRQTGRARWRHYAALGLIPVKAGVGTADDTTVSP